MNTVKFKVWNIENKCWFKKGLNLETGEYSEIFLNADGRLIMRTSGEVGHGSFQKLFDVNDKFELCLSTGLLDKNRKEIYRGDIGEYTGGGFKNTMFEGLRVFVQWCSGAYWVRARLDSEDSFGLGITASNNKHIEIIGNIFENPELLS